MAQQESECRYVPPPALRPWVRLRGVLIGKVEAVDLLALNPWIRINLVGQQMVDEPCCGNRDGLLNRLRVQKICSVDHRTEDPDDWATCPVVETGDD